MEEHEYFSLEQFNDDLWSRLERLNNAPFTKKEYCRSYYWEAEREDLMELPLTPYEYMERKVAKVSSDYHIRFDNAYYSVGREFLHKEVLIRASVSTVKIYLAGWMENSSGVLRFFLIAVGTAALWWLCAFLGLRAQAKKMNQKIKEKQKKE